MVLAHLHKVLQTPRFKCELVDLCPVSIRPFVLLPLPLQKEHPLVLSDAVHSVALLLGTIGVQRKGGAEARGTEPDVAQPATPVEGHHVDQMVKRWPVTTRVLAHHLARDHGDLEAHVFEQPREEAVVFKAEPSPALVHYLVEQKRGFELDSTAAVYREVFERDRQKVAGVDRPQHVQAGSHGARKPNAGQVLLQVHVNGRHCAVLKDYCSQ